MEYVLISLNLLTFKLSQAVEGVISENYTGSVTQFEGLKIV